MPMKRTPHGNLPAGQMHLLRYMSGDISVTELYDWAASYVDTRKPDPRNVSWVIATFVIFQANAVATRFTESVDEVLAVPGKERDALSAFVRELSAELKHARPGQ